MEFSKSNAIEAERIPGDVDNASNPSIPCPSITNKRTLEVAFPNTVPHRDAKRARSQPPLCTPPEQREDTNVTRSENGVAPNDGDSATLSSDSLATDVVEPGLSLNTAPINETLTIDNNNHVSTTYPTPTTNQAQTDIPIDPVLFQQSLTTAPGAGDGTTVSGKSSVMEQIDSAAPAEADTKEEASNTESEIIRQGVDFACEELKHFLEQSRNIILNHVYLTKQNTTDSIFGESAAVIIVHEIMESMAIVALPKLRADVKELFFPSKDDWITPDEDIRTTVGPNPPLDDAGDTSSVSADPNQRHPIAIPLTARCNDYQNVSTQTESIAIDSPSMTHESSTPDPGCFDDTELWKRELESIRRLRPLVTGHYTTVNVPLRETVEKDVPEKKKTKKEVTIKTKLPARYPLRSMVNTRRNISNDIHSVINVSDTDDDDVNLLHPRESCHVGGGNISSYDASKDNYSSEDDFATSNVQETQRLTWRPRDTDPSNEKIRSMDGALDEEERVLDENDLAERARYLNQPIFPMQQYDSNTNGAGDYDGRYPLNYNSKTEVFGWGDAPVHPTVDCRSRISAERERSRSVEHHQGRLTERHAHLVSRDHSPRYPGGTSPLQTRREDSERHRIKPIAQGNLFKSGKLRYVRDSPENITFYGFSPNRKLNREIEDVLRYQDRLNEVGEVPGPESSLRFKLNKYVHDTGSGGIALEQEIKRVIEDSFYACETLDEEQALQNTWTKQPKGLYKGFPLVEDIEFVSIRNQAKPDGDCYWRSLAYILHGNAARWNMIKADHLTYMQHVLGDKTHPRHELYTKLNAQFFQTQGGGWKNGEPYSTHQFKANIWQLLHLPHSWTPGVMQQITADLYNIHLITFTYIPAKNLCSEVSIRGAYNSRHVFILFTDNSHFQPLTVNEYLS
ncbi:hypothetical protein NPX13_g5472 [Xylaria arbuscula]|uniref:OTU domain-containing protein n=1 Tax=Xylaria arbuscula TaxID=114810 RepID=A0A9W8NE38_9PEZI|nr:hypothetical protein NPX13_g5472 [Xylaria arbuscula]